ncbi:hypothetical protein B0A49_12379 [Cryomyces minteri]|uniref:Uncharacterized protein n=1 Tax=Cryomyces minteri TaxID=331657 RepID=A0A4U0WUG2_9PEZI|nr:hypothetical protein B0A49_12379 [Cryomyces minteri]
MYDWVDGYLLPKGTTIIINAWGLQHDPMRFENPDVFDPEHIAGCTKLAPELANGAYEDRDHYGYGAGRRLCPGIHLAERNLSLAMAKLVWGFEIFPALDGEGREKAVDTDAKTGFEVRGKTREDTIRREFGEAQEVFAGYES